MQSSLTTKGVSMIILMRDSVSGWILWSKLASCTATKLSKHPHISAISSYPQQMIVLRGSVIHNLVEVREVSVQINIIGIVSADQIVFGSLK